MKYFTAFVYDFTDEENPIHCTHKYLGELTSTQVHDVECLVTGYFVLNGRNLPHMEFTERKYFGPRKNIPVLVPTEFDPKKLLPTLREALNLFRSDDYAGYQPHITTELERIDVKFSGYALMSKNKIIRLWRTDQCE